MKNRISSLLILIIALAFMGFLDSTYLTITHYQNIFPPCSVTQKCETVLQSQYANIGPIPVSLLGSLFFLGLMMTTIAYFESKKKTFKNILVFSSIVGLLVSLIFFYIQFIVLGAFCQYCLASEVVSLLIFILTLYFVKISDFGSKSQI